MFQRPTLKGHPIPGKNHGFDYRNLKLIKLNSTDSRLVSLETLKSDEEEVEENEPCV